MDNDEARALLGSVRVIGAIDSGFWRAFAPLDDSFLVRPDGSLVH